MCFLQKLIPIKKCIKPIGSPVWMLNILYYHCDRFWPMYHFSHLISCYMSVSFQSSIHAVHAGSFVTEDFTPGVRISTEMYLLSKTESQGWRDYCPGSVMDRPVRRHWIAGHCFHCVARKHSGHRNGVSVSVSVENSMKISISWIRFLSCLLHLLIEPNVRQSPLWEHLTTCVL